MHVTENFPENPKVQLVVWAFDLQFTLRPHIPEATCWNRCIQKAIVRLEIILRLNCLQTYRWAIRSAVTALLCTAGLLKGKGSGFGFFTESREPDRLSGGVARVVLLEKVTYLRQLEVTKCKRITKATNHSSSGSWSDQQGVKFSVGP